MLMVYFDDFILPPPPFFFSSGYFNGAQFFNNDPRTDYDYAAGGMYRYVIMGFLWLIGVPILVVAIVMVSATHMYICKNIESEIT